MLQNNTRKELMVFGVELLECRQKQREHKINAISIQLDIIEAKLNIIELNNEGTTVRTMGERILWKGAIADMEELYKEEMRNVRKWVYYENLLMGYDKPEGKIDEDDIQRAKDFDMIALVSQDIALKKAGRGHWACCPFHSEDTPSFVVQNNRYHCFGCGADGDTVDWLTEYRGMDFIEAVKLIS